ncbi:hypothetical protein GOP47_0017152 [Adiantum capillus-veneris]|uniref:Protein kinase domain-containing protein n=1 Tax=Adiantum capillus-veneris TaxID=13818 RepID=A0A9D4UJD5_ADICA|nr:hypothetical protein GOP47_0016674 [Adiantum capillus-veneris]KAI5068807.1 hypothetical protein GOP47_0017152 [Adiantum capillus-veneris]
MIMPADLEDMIRRRYRSLFLLFFMLCSLSSQVISAVSARATLRASSSTNSSVVDSDLAALVAMKAALIDYKGILQSWNTSRGSACGGGWVGVKCEAGRIIAIHLPSKGLGGQLAAEIGQLSYLRQLSVHTNAITGAIPVSISSLRNLRGLYLFHNLLTGSIPASLSPVLQALDLSNNHLSGAIPTSLSTSALLRRINLSYNNLSSTIPSTFSSLARLQALLLSHNQLVGAVPDFSQLANLQTLDLSQNLLKGSFPALQQSSAGASQTGAIVHSSATSSSKELFPSLFTLNLSHNALTGKLPSQIGELSSLLQLDLSNNKFSGAIPPQLANITELSSLDISHNNFTGSLPSSLSSLGNLTHFNCSFNSLTGKVPKLRHTFLASAFVGNKGLCGFSPASLCALPPAPSPETGAANSSGEAAAASTGEKKKKLSALSIVFVVIGIVIVLFLLMCLCSLLFICCCRRSGESMAKAGFTGEKPGQAGGGKGEGAKREGDAPGGKLVHFEGSLGFLADDLLCATAEVVGKSTYGTVYKATLEDGNQVAVKRLREGIVKSQRDFEVEVTAVGAIRHPNLLALRSYYWGPKDEKLLIFDFMQGGSLAAFVHARGPETPLTWQMRMNIAIGAAKGLVYLHEEQKMIHGNLTSSNILIDAHQNAKLSDFGLSRLMTQAANSNVIATAGALGYRAPELTKLRKATTKSDVYSFGIVLLELLTGKAPGEGPSSGPTEGTTMDLPDWVASIVKQEWTQEVFDIELMKGRAPGDEELINTLQLAMNCVTLAPLERPEMSEVLQQLEQIKPDLKQ